MQTRYIIAALALSVVALSASSLERQFPYEARRGVASFNAYPKIIIDGAEYRPAPGLRIWNTYNMIQFQTSIKSENIPINYTIDPYRLIDRIWILTPREAAKAMPPKGRPGTMTSNVTVTVPNASNKSQKTVTITNQ